MKKLLKENWNYRLFEENNKYTLKVVCGSVAVEEKTIELKPNEVEDYNKYGKEYINKLAENIRINMKDFENRFIPK